MKKVEKTVYVAYNGAEFDTAEACNAHERKCAWTEHMYKAIGREPDIDEVWSYLETHAPGLLPKYPPGFVEPGSEAPLAPGVPKLPAVPAPGAARPKMVGKLQPPGLKWPGGYERTA